MTETFSEIASAPAADNVIETRSLTRYFGRRCVVDAVNLHVPRGSVFGLLGRNGSGKTTMLRMLLGLLAPTRGSASILGYDCTCLLPEARARIGYLSEGHVVYGWMSVRQCGEFQAAFYPKWNNAIFQAVVDHFGLTPKARAKDISRGERAGLCLALTLAPEPELLILDDPALGLDPVARRALLEAFVFVTRRSDRTIVFSSHLLTDIERVADRIAIMDRSVLRAVCSIDTFRAQVRQFVLHFNGTLPDPLPEIPGLLSAVRTGNAWRITLANVDEETLTLLKALRPQTIEPVDTNLEEALTSYMSDRGKRSSFLQSLGGAV